MWDELLAGERTIGALADRAGAEAVKVLALLRSAALLGYLDLVDGTPSLTAAGRGLVHERGYFTWGSAGTAELHIHRNTLNYRLKRISTLTGLNPVDTADARLLAAALVVNGLSEAP